MVLDLQNPGGNRILLVMKKIGLLVLVFFLCGMAYAQDVALLENKPVSLGERLVYKITYGFLNIGEARIETSPAVHALNDLPCYKIDISGKTTGAVSWLTKVDDRWGAMLDTKSLLPLKTYRIVRENNYKRDEVSYFDHGKKNIRYYRYDYGAEKFNDPKHFTFTETVRDLIGGYYYLRQVDYSKLVLGDTIKLYGFFEDEFYKFDILYKGKEKINTQFGEVAAIKLVPVMPDNEVFKGENSISLWLSDDENRIPLKAEANMFIGTAGCDIIAYDNLKNSFTSSKRSK